MKSMGRPLHADLLAAARDARDLTQQEMADVLGVARSTYSNAERGHQGNEVFEGDGLKALLTRSEYDDITAAWEGRARNNNPNLAADLAKYGLFVPKELLQGLIDARVTRFHPSRQYYELLREGRSTISDYIRRSKDAVEIVSINLATGGEIERVTDAFFELLTGRPPVRVVVSLLDPDQDHLMKSIAPVLNQSPGALALRIQETLSDFVSFADERLSRAQKQRFIVRAHRALPNASAIIIDGDKKDGTIQLETKGYKMGMNKSFGFEVSAPSSFFRDLRDSYRHLIADGRKIIGEYEV